MEKERTRNTKERVRRGLLWDQIRGLDVGATKFNSELSHFVPHLNRFVFFFFWNETRIPLPIPKCTMHLCFFRKLFRSIGMDMSIKRVDWIRERKSSFGGESSFQSWLLWLLRAAYTGFSVGNTFFFFLRDVHCGGEGNFSLLSRWSCIRSLFSSSIFALLQRTLENISYKFDPQVWKNLPMRYDYFLLKYNKS